MRFLFLSALTAAGLPVLASETMMLQQADGIVKEERLVAGPLDGFVSDWSRDGQYLLHRTQGDPETRADLWQLEQGEILSNVVDEDLKSGGVSLCLDQHSIFQ